MLDRRSPVAAGGCNDVYVSEAPPSEDGAGAVVAANRASYRKFPASLRRPRPRRAAPTRGDCRNHAPPRRPTRGSRPTTTHLPQAAIAPHALDILPKMYFQ